MRQFDKNSFVIKMINSTSLRKSDPDLIHVYMERNSDWVSLFVYSRMVLRLWLRRVIDNDIHTSLSEIVLNLNLLAEFYSPSVWLQPIFRINVDMLFIGPFKTNVNNIWTRLQFDSRKWIMMLNVCHFVLVSKVLMYTASEGHSRFCHNFARGSYLISAINTLNKYRGLLIGFNKVERDSISGFIAAITMNKAWAWCTSVQYTGSLLWQYCVRKYPSSSITWFR